MVNQEQARIVANKELAGAVASNAVLDECIVSYKGERYDVTDFVRSHPGGPQSILAFRDQDMTEAYDEIGHSPSAHKLLAKRRIVKSEDSRKAREVGAIDIKYTVKKLFTPEDRYHLHKTLGGLALCSFIYRYFWVLPTTGTLGFGGPLAQNFYFNCATLGLHLCLSYSSIIFHVLEKRIIERPLIIYEEYRLHAMLFTTRAVAVSVIGMLQHLILEKYRQTVLVISVILISSLVDGVTAKYGTPGVTAVRIQRDDNEPAFLKYLKLFYASYQFLALGSQIRISSTLCDLGFNGIIAIQSSAFLMTLKRKSLIRWYSHAFWYSLALALSTYYMYVAKGGYFFLSVLPVYLLRVTFNLDKYLLWACYLVLLNGNNDLLPESIKLLLR